MACFDGKKFLDGVESIVVVHGIDIVLSGFRGNGVKFTHINVLSNTDRKHVDSRVSQERGLARRGERMVGAAVGDDDGDADDAVARGVSGGEEVAADVAERGGRVRLTPGLLDAPDRVNNLKEQKSKQLKCRESSQGGLLGATAMF